MSPPQEKENARPGEPGTSDFDKRLDSSTLDTELQGSMRLDRFEPARGGRP